MANGINQDRRRLIGADAALVAAAQFGSARAARESRFGTLKDDFRVIILTGLALEIQSVDVRKFHIQNQAGRHVGLRVCDVLSRRTERDRPQIEGREELG